MPVIDRYSLVLQIYLNNGGGELENLAKSRDEAKHASEKVEDKHWVGLEEATVDPPRNGMSHDVKIRAQGIRGLRI